MEQRFTWQGQQYEPRSFNYEGKNYMLNAKIPSGENKWSEQVPTDTYGGYPSDKGLQDFYHYYASNTGIPGPYRPRPVKTATPLFQANGVSQLFYDTQLLQYSTEDGQPPSAPIPNQGDKLIGQYEYGTFYSPPGQSRKEKCGCGGPLLPIHM